MTWPHYVVNDAAEVNLAAIFHDRVDEFVGRWWPHILAEDRSRLRCSARAKKRRRYRAVLAVRSCRHRARLAAILLHGHAERLVMVLVKALAVEQASILLALLLCGKLNDGLSSPPVTSISEDGANEEAEEDDQAGGQPRD